MKKKSKKIVLMIAVLISGFLFFTGIRMATLDTEVVLVMDYAVPESEFIDLDYQTGYGQWAVAINGKTIAKSSEDLEMRPTASTTKMILALAVMEKKPFNLGESGETLTITQEMYDRYAWYFANNGSVAAVVVGEEISQYDALAATLVVSSNNMADALAEWAFGSIDNYREFAMEMLSRMGLTHTKIGVDASGYDESTVSTAEDLAKIGEAVLAQPVLADIVAKTEISIPVAGKLENTNKLLGQLGVVGVKTGYIGDVSGYCLVSGYLVGESTVTVAVMGAPSRASSFGDSENLIKALQERLKVKNVVTEGDEVGHYESWWTGKVPIVANESKEDVMYGDFAVDLEMSGLSGELTVASEYDKYTVPVVVKEEFTFEPTFWQRFWRVFGWENKK